MRDAEITSWMQCHERRRGQTRASRCRYLNATLVSVSQVPTAAAMYYDDIYVERLLSEQTAALVGSEGGKSPNFPAIARAKRSIPQVSREYPACLCAKAS